MGFLLFAMKFFTKLLKASDLEIPVFSFFFEMTVEEEEEEVEEEGTAKDV